MKTARMLTILIVALGLMMSLPKVSEAGEPMGTAFTYQGHLYDDGSPANGTYDFEFELYDSNDPCTGDQLAGPIEVNDCNVIDAYFVVELDFGSNVFDGNAVWLETTVAHYDGSDPCTLSPRLELAPVPYALYAASGGGWVDDGAVVRLETSSDIIGVGTTEPGAKLHVQASPSGETPDNIAGLFVENSGISNNWYVFQTATAGGGKSFSITNEGRIGIGTTSPTSLLDVFQGTIRSSRESTQYIEIKDVDSGGGFITGHSREGNKKPLRIQAVHDGSGSPGGETYMSFRVGNESSPTTAMTIKEDGDIGIGTTSPGAKLEVTGSSSEPIVRATNSGSQHGVYGEASGANGAGVHGYGTNATGNAGIAGHATGTYGLGVYGKAYGSDGWGVKGEDSSGNVGAIGHEAFGAYGKNHGLDNWGALGADWAGVYGEAPAPDYAGSFRGNVRINDYSTGDLAVKLGTGLDYAEGFDISDKSEIVPGTVLVIDSENAGKLAISNKAYDSRVAGIAAGAKGMGSGVRLGPEEFDCDVALAGRVYCNVDATEAAVKPGDLLTTAATPGYAMKAKDYIRTQGAILGKAMERLEKGKKGQILVLVTLQ